MLSCTGVAATPQSWPGKPYSLMHLKEEEQVVVKKMLWSRHCGKSDCGNERENLQEDLQLFESMFGVAVWAGCHLLKKSFKNLSHIFPSPLQVVLTHQNQLHFSLCALN